MKQKKKNDVEQDIKKTLLIFKYLIKYLKKV